ncbi:MAG TPA: RHS repeat-associated core domain-containing protein [Caulobacteraceae bacterium]
MVRSQLIARPGLQVRRFWLGLALALVSGLLVVGHARATTPTYTTDYVWDAGGRLTTVIRPDPGTGIRPATKFTYDPDGEVIQVDKGTTTNSSGSDFTAQERVANTFDAVGNKIVAQVIDPTTSTTLAVSQTAYDLDDRPLCSAVRMNPSTFASLPADGCTLGTAGSYGQDRITRTTYDAAGQKLIETRAYGVVGLQQDYVTNTYSPNGKLLTEKDANGNLTGLTYDGFDRLVKMNFPSTTLAAGTSSTTDYETYGYDAGGNRVSLRKRDGRYLSWCYDGLNREVTKYITQVSGAVTCTLNVATGAVTPGTAPSGVDVTTAYDLLGRKGAVSFASGAMSVAYTYDNASRLLTETTAGRQLSYQYDAAGNRSRITWPDSVYASYSYDALNHLTQATDSAANSLVTPGYDGLGRRTAMARGNGASTSYGFDNADRLTSLTQDLAGTASDVTLTFPYNPASQILSRGVSNAAYDWATSAPTTTNKTYDGLNRDAAIATVGSPCAASGAGYDCNGNLTYDGARTFTYDVENRLLSASAPTAITLSYDPLGRLQQTTAGSTTTTFLYDGGRLVAEYNGSTLLRRYVHGAGVDEPLVWYEGSGTTDRRWLHADNQGSIVAWSNTSGTAGEVYTYGPYGEPTGWSGGSRFRYTGQIAIPEAQLYYYKARVYDPGSGRFLQTDPIGYKDDLDLYAYVGEDPVDRQDSTGEWAFRPMGSCGSNIVCSPWHPTIGRNGANAASRSSTAQAKGDPKGAKHAADIFEQLWASQHAVLESMAAHLKNGKLLEGAVKGSAFVGDLATGASAIAGTAHDIKHGVDPVTATYANLAAAGTTELIVKSSQGVGAVAGGIPGTAAEPGGGTAAGALAGAVIFGIGGGILDAATGASEKVHDKVLEGAGYKPDP